MILLWVSWFTSVLVLCIVISRLWGCRVWGLSWMVERCRGSINGSGIRVHSRSWCMVVVSEG